MFVERSLTSTGGGPSGAYIHYDAGIFQLGTDGSGVVTPVVSRPTTSQSVRGVTSDSLGNLYVAGATLGFNAQYCCYISSSFIDVYGPNLTASSTPVRRISVPGLDTTEALAVDGAGQLYGLSVQTGTVYVFASGANGAATPIRTISGGNTGIAAGHAFSIAADSGGQVYVSNFELAQVLVFAAGATGNVAPIRTLSISAGSAYGLAVDSSSNLYVLANDTTGTSGNHLASKGTILKFAPGATTPTNTIQGSATTLYYGGCMTIDAAGNLWLVNLTEDANSNATPSVLEFAAGANGNVAPAKSLTFSAWQPSSGPSIAVL